MRIQLLRVRTTIERTAALALAPRLVGERSNEESSCLNFISNAGADWGNKWCIYGRQLTVAFVVSHELYTQNRVISRNYV